MACTLHEVLVYGPIVHSDNETGVLITINGAYLNWWNPIHAEGRSDQALWSNVECRSGHPDLYTLAVAKAMTLAEDWYNEVMNVSQDDEVNGDA